jgi:glycine/D-amino acid oxidase-like deaminating enzyme
MVASPPTFNAQVASTTAPTSTPVKTFLGSIRGTKPRVAVAGGSIGGMIAALELAEKGYDVTIYEASKRVGGKMVTVTDEATGHRIEVGAEIIDESQTDLRNLCDRLGVALVDRAAEDEAHAAKAGQGETECGFHVGGVLRTAKDFIDPETGQGPYEALRAQIAADLAQARNPNGTFSDAGRKLDAITIDEYLEQHKDLAPDWVMTAIRQGYTSEIGHDSGKLSALNLIDFISSHPGEFDLYAGSDEKYRVAGGMGTIVEKLAAELEKKGVKFAPGHQLLEANTLEGGRKQLTFATSDGQTETIDADAVVCAIPPTKLRNVRGLEHLGIDDAPVSQRYNATTGTMEQLSRKDIITGLQYNSLDKITLPLNGAPWQTDAAGKLTGLNGEMVGDGAYQVAWTNTDETGKGWVTFLIGGDSVQGDKQAVKEAAMRDYATALGKPVEAVFDMPRVQQGAGVATEWWRSGGCYPAPQQGMYAALDDFSRNPSRDQRVGLVGNYIPNGNQVGFVNCSVKSGLAAAQQIERTLPVLQRAEPSHSMAIPR